MYQRIREMRENNKIEAGDIARVLNVGEAEYLHTNEASLTCRWRLRSGCPGIMT